MSDLTDAVGVAPGGADACALLSNGHVNCWGSGSAGELGNGSTPPSESDMPVEVQGIVNATEVVAGGEHACAALSSGHVDCWGANENGQLGNGEEGLNGHSGTPVEVQGITNASQVAAQGWDSCALLSSGHIDCWGWNWSGQLGNGEGGLYVNSAKPVEVRGITNATEVATGSNYSCAVLSGGHVECWGSSSGGQLGDGKTHTEPPYGSYTPVEVQGIAGATEVAAGGYHSCALLSSEHIECWGWNQSGQLGDDSTRNSDTPVEVRGITNATEVAAGGEHSCALLSSGHIDCWGENGSGELGNGSTMNSRTPVEVHALAMPSYALLLSSRVSPNQKGKLSLKLSCSHGTSPCTGTVAITLAERLKHHRSKTLLLGTARYTLKAASSGKVTLSLNSHARALLARAASCTPPRPSPAPAPARTPSTEGSSRSKSSGRRPSGQGRCSARKAGARISRGTPPPRTKLRSLGPRLAQTPAFRCIAEVSA